MTSKSLNFLKAGFHSIRENLHAVLPSSVPMSLFFSCDHFYPRGYSHGCHAAFPFSINGTLRSRSWGNQGKRGVKVNRESQPLREEPLPRPGRDFFPSELSLYPWGKFDFWWVTTSKEQARKWEWRKSWAPGSHVLPRRHAGTRGKWELWVRDIFFCSQKRINNRWVINLSCSKVK